MELAAPLCDGVDTAPSVLPRHESVQHRSTATSTELSLRAANRLEGTLTVAHAAAATGLAATLSPLNATQAGLAAHIGSVIDVRTALGRSLFGDLLARQLLHISNVMVRSALDVEWLRSGLTCGESTWAVEGLGSGLWFGLACPMRRDHRGLDAARVRELAPRRPLRCWRGPTGRAERIN